MVSQIPIPDGLSRALRGARHIVALTGSGISAESGIPTFRDAQTGLWEQYNPQDLATPEAFLQDPKLVWDWYRWRRKLVLECEPNAAHEALASLATLANSFTLITQNVDGLHQRAGSMSVIEFHGNLFDDRCFVERALVESARLVDDVPTCPTCGGLLRPGVVWFGETIPPAAMNDASAAVADCDVFLSIGTSSLVWPAAGFAEEAKRRGAVTVEVNPNATPMSASFDYRLAGNAAHVVPELVNCVAPGVE